MILYRGENHSVEIAERLSPEALVGGEKNGRDEEQVTHGEQKCRGELQRVRVRLARVRAAVAAVICKQSRDMVSRSAEASRSRGNLQTVK